jgi:predicted nucleic acid-binding protein
VGVFERETQLVKVLIDTNIIVDVALDRDPFFAQSEQIVRLAEVRQIEGYISASTFGDLYYIIRKARGKDWTLQFLQRMDRIWQVATVDRAVVAMALTLNFGDFEDAIQYSTAVINHLDAVVTRNPQDFVGAALPIMTPDILIQSVDLLDRP